MLLRCLLLSSLTLVGAGGTAVAGGVTARVVIDPGHGGSDPGALGNGLTEKEVNLDIALRLRLLLLLDTLDPSGGGSWEVQLTRESDETVSLQARVALANAWPADRFISIHHNGWGSSSANGTETYSYPGAATAADLRNHVHAELVAGLGLADRGVKTADFYVLRETTMPAVLSEGGFLTNPVDAAVLASPAGRQASAQAHLFGLQRHYGLTPYLPLPDPEPYCTAKLTSSGCLPQVSWINLPSATNGFSVSCSAVEPQKTGILFWGLQAAATPFQGGTLCAAPPLFRTDAQNSGGSPALPCSGYLQHDFSPADFQAQGWTPGSEVFLQWWFRDPASSPYPVGLSNGLHVVVLP